MLQQFFQEKRYTPITTLKKLHEYLQSAVTLEFATIPAYTTAMYSMKDKACDAYRLTASVAMEEMFHVYQVANLLLAVGGIPKFTGDHTPKYPTFIPHGDTKTTPYISLQRATKELYKDVFMRIETPAEFTAPPQNEHIQTIGQFYKAIALGIIYLYVTKGKKIFKDTDGYEQHQDYYFGKGGGHIIKVTDLKSAMLAIIEIVQQGEGAELSYEVTNIAAELLADIENAMLAIDKVTDLVADVDDPVKGLVAGFKKVTGLVDDPEKVKGLVADLKSAMQAIRQAVHRDNVESKQPWGAYNHYGQRDDGQYGPILGLPKELSHYCKFKEVADGETSLPSTYPAKVTEVVEEPKNSKAKDLYDAFNIAYSEFLRNLEQSFKAGEDGSKPYFEKCVRIMHKVLPKLANQLMNTCFYEDGDNNVGPNALPGWLYVKEGEGDINQAIELVRKITETQITETPIEVSNEAHMMELKTILQELQAINVV